MRKGHDIGKWMPFEIEAWLSDPDIQSWYDDQEKWYLRLLLQAWKNSTNPCHLPNEPERLMTLAGVPISNPMRVRAWKERSAAVLRKFVKTEDGKWLVNAKQMEVYTNQLASWDARRDAGSKGGKVRAERLASLKLTTSELQVNSSRQSLSLSTSPSDSKNEKKELDSEDLVSRVMAIGFRDSTWRSKSQIERALFEEVQAGADTGEMFNALRRIYKWTDSGIYAKPCFEVIPRWREPQNLWERKANAKSNEGLQDVSRQQLRAERDSEGIKRAFDRLRGSTGAADGGHPEILP